MTVVRVDLRQPAVRARLREIKPPASTDPFPFSDSVGAHGPPGPAAPDRPARRHRGDRRRGAGAQAARVGSVAAHAGGAGGRRRGRDRVAAPLGRLCADAAGGAGPASRRPVPGPAGGDAVVRASAHGAHPPHRRRRPRLARGVRAGPGRAPDAGRDLRRRLVDRAAPIDPPRWGCASRRSGKAGSARSPTSPCGWAASSTRPSEPYMGSQLPARWEVDKRLLPAEAPYPQPAAAHGPAAGAGPRAGGRGPRRPVPAAVPPARGLQRGRAHGHRRARGSAAGAGEAAARVRAAAGRGARGSTRSGRRRWMRRSGASCSATSSRSSPRRATIRRRASASCSRPPRSDRRTACRSRCSRTGCGPTRRAWSRRARPRRRSGSSTALDPGTRLSAALHREAPPSGATAWVLDALTGNRAAKAAERPSAAAGGQSADAPPAPSAAAPDPRLRPSWEVPRGLRWYVGARAWRSPWRWLTFAPRAPAGRARHRPGLGAPDRELPVPDRRPPDHRGPLPRVRGGRPVPDRRRSWSTCCSGSSSPPRCVAGARDSGSARSPSSPAGSAARRRPSRSPRSPGSACAATTRAWPAPPRTSSSTARSGAPRSPAGSASGSAGSIRR